jgi:hypothetical protein
MSGKSPINFIEWLKVIDVKPEDCYVRNGTYDRIDFAGDYIEMRLYLIALKNGPKVRQNTDLKAMLLQEEDLKL